MEEIRGSYYLEAKTLSAECEHAKFHPSLINSISENFDLDTILHGNLPSQHQFDGILIYVQLDSSFRAITIYRAALVLLC